MKQVGLKLVTGLLALLVFCCARSVQSAQVQDEKEESSLFDFKQYQAHFNKHYGSLMEQINRHALFTANMLKVAASRVKFMLWKQDYYLGPNQMSDFTRQELRVLVRKRAVKATHERTKRSFDEQIHVNVFNSSGKIVDVSKLDQENDFVDDERIRTTSSLREQMKPGFYSNLAFEDDDEAHNLLSIKKKLRRIIEEDKSAKLNPVKSHNSRDKIDLDHSQDKCMSRPKNQGKCASCYAFAALTIYEFLYCKRHGELLEFSEQHVVDCGLKYIGEPMMFGCDGGSDHGVSEFVQNFGLELSENYPYQGRVQECPLNDAANIKTTGYVRAENPYYHVAPIELWEEYLVYAPLVVDVFINNEFVQYEYGVHELRGCNKEEAHSMVLVGHGKQNGVKYWKMRNSASEEWGEQGYYRVSRTSNECLGDSATAFMTLDGRNYMLDGLEKNKNYVGLASGEGGLLERMKKTIAEWIK